MPQTPGRFILKAPFTPTGDQPTAIASLVSQLRGGKPAVTLLGATGTGKTFTMANVIAALGSADPDHQPQQDARGAALRGAPRASSRRTRSTTSSRTTTTTNPRRTSRSVTSTSRRTPAATTIWTSCDLRPPATSSRRRDTVVVASVSCIFGLGSPQAYAQRVLTMTKGSDMTAREFLLAMNAMQYQRVEVSSSGGRSASGATASRSGPPTRSSRCGSTLRRSRSTDRADQPDERGDHRGGEAVLPLPGGALRDARGRAVGDRAARSGRSWMRAVLELRIAGQAARGAAPDRAHQVRPGDDRRGRILPGIENYSRYMDGRARASGRTR
jgi:hypothetical protein